VGRKKQLRLESNIGRKNLFQSTNEGYTTIKGQWHTSFFKNENPIVIELGCGKGEYTIGMAQEYANKNFIGIDVKGDRLAVGCNNADELTLNNVAFLRTDILEIGNFFAENEVSEIWITFPDPRTRKRDARRRLTYTRFLNLYNSICKPNSKLHLKTDNRPFFDFSLESLQDFGATNIQSTFDLYKSDLLTESKPIKTRFEEIFTGKGFDINFLTCIFNPSIKK
jgi:tRNA (guanine-N7-)-methyltransferase